MSVELHWDLYKPSGKWAYGGIVSISGDHKIWNRIELLAEIDALQSEVQKGVISGLHYIVVLRETDAQSADPNYHDFYQHMYMSDF